MRIRLTCIFLIFLAFVLTTDVHGVDGAKLGECKHLSPKLDEMTGKPRPASHGAVHCRDTAWGGSILVPCRRPPSVIFGFWANVTGKSVRIRLDGAVEDAEGELISGNSIIPHDSLVFLGQDWIDRMKKHDEFWIEFRSDSELGPKHIAKFNLSSFTQEYAKCRQPSAGED